MKAKMEQLRGFEWQSRPGMTEEEVVYAFEELCDKHIVIIEDMYCVSSVKDDENFWIVKFWTSPYNATILKNNCDANGKYIGDS